MTTEPDQTYEGHQSMPEPTGDVVDVYEVEVRHLKTGGRSDWVVGDDAHLPTPINSDDFVSALRRFFVAMDEEINAHLDDPIATGQAFARMDALLADMRMLRDRLRTVTAESLREFKVRRLTVESIVTLEATTSLDRHDWEHERLLIDMMTWCFGPSLVMTETGDIVNTDDVARRLLSWFRPEWRLTPIRDANLDPDDYCEFTEGDDGKPVRVPTLKVVDNKIRGR